VRTHTQEKGRGTRCLSRGGKDVAPGRVRAQHFGAPNDDQVPGRLSVREVQCRRISGLEKAEEED
jgi:hypothetical protein